MGVFDKAEKRYQTTAAQAQIAPAMMKERIRRLSPETQHAIMAGGAMGFYGLD